MFHESLKFAQTQQKSYADKQRRDLSFEISDFFISRSHPWEAATNSKSRETWHPNTLDHSRSLTAKEK
jgi:hypothetical protein